jgi:endonuclease YncB( thermonuclease family)
MTRRNDRPLPLHSEQPSRTRPSRRRRLVARGSNNNRRQAALGRWTLIFGVLVGLSVLGGAVLRSGNDEPADDPPADLLRAVPVQVVDIIDGDTLHIEDAAGEVLTVRLFGIDTPERGEPCYAEAANRLRELAGSQVLLVADERLQDPGGRELRYVYTETGTSIDAVMLDEGLAVAWTADGALRDQFVAIEQDARTAHRGCLWTQG